MNRLWSVFKVTALLVALAVTGGAQAPSEPPDILACQFQSQLKDGNIATLAASLSRAVKDGAAKDAEIIRLRAEVEELKKAKASN